MGFSRGNEVFDPVATIVLGYVDNQTIPAFVAKNILERLIEKLQEVDWDTEDESLHEFLDEPIVVEAFRRNEIYISIEE